MKKLSALLQVVLAMSVLQGCVLWRKTFGGEKNSELYRVNAAEPYTPQPAPTYRPADERTAEPEPLAEEEAEEAVSVRPERVYLTNSTFSVTVSTNTSASHTVRTSVVNRITVTEPFTSRRVRRSVSGSSRTSVSPLQPGVVPSRNVAPRENGWRARKKETSNVPIFIAPPRYVEPIADLENAEPVAAASSRATLADEKGQRIYRQRLWAVAKAEDRIPSEYWPGGVSDREKSDTETLRKIASGYYEPARRIVYYRSQAPCYDGYSGYYPYNSSGGHYPSYGHGEYYPSYGDYGVNYGDRGGYSVYQPYSLGYGFGRRASWGWSASLGGGTVGLRRPYYGASYQSWGGPYPSSYANNYGVRYERRY